MLTDDHRYILFEIVPSSLRHRRIVGTDSEGSERVGRQRWQALARAITEIFRSKETNKRQRVLGLIGRQKTAQIQQTVQGKSTESDFENSPTGFTTWNSSSHVLYSKQQRIQYTYYNLPSF